MTDIDKCNNTFSNIVLGLVTLLVILIIVYLVLKYYNKIDFYTSSNCTPNGQDPWQTKNHIPCCNDSVEVQEGSHYMCRSCTPDGQDPWQTKNHIPCCKGTVEKHEGDHFMCRSSSPSPPTDSNIIIGTLNCLTSVSTGKGASWGLRVPILKQVISKMNCDVLCVQECSEQMISDLFTGTGYTTIANNSGVQKNPDKVSTNLGAVNAPGRVCNNGETNPNTPCCRYTGKGSLQCHYQGNMNDENARCKNDTTQPIVPNVGHRIMYKNNKINLVSGGRAMFNLQGGCPIWDSQRFYEYADFKVKKDGKKFTVYGPHTSQSKDNNTDKNNEGWGREANIAQNKEIYNVSMSNYNKTQIPFVIAADLNYKADSNPTWKWSDQQNVNIDANMGPGITDHSVDYIISYKSLHATNVTYTPTNNGTDHPYGLSATYSI